MNAADLPDETLFENALKCRTPEERAAYLGKACAGQPELRERLETLLAAHDASGEFLDPAAAVRSTLTLDLTPEEKPGTAIGRYKLLQKIGEGGMGIVYMAEQTAPVVRKVAFKIIKLGMDTKQVVARFEAERQALALMDHSNIAKVLDAGSTDAGRPYFVMELVHGVPITEYCDKNKLSTQQRLELFIPVCHAIQHAHQKGIIHRDIKPSNVMVTLHDGVPVPKVIDFGVAKATNQRLTEKTLFTNYAQMIGTPAYMSPEQAEMSGLDIDTRSDIYSLGVLLYELLTGTTPFDAKELLSKGYAEMQRIIVEQEPAKPSTRMSTLTDEQRTVVASHRNTAASVLRRVLEGDLDWIVMKCLEKDRTRRYETSNGLAMDLRRHLGGETVLAAPPTASYRVRKFVKRNRGQVIAACVILFVLLSGMAGTTWGFIRAELRRKDAERARLAEERERKFAQAVADFVKDDFLALTSVEGQEHSGGGELDRNANLMQLLDRAAGKLKARKDLAPRIEAELCWIVGVSYRGAGEAAKGVPFLERAVELRRRTLGLDHPDTLISMDNLASAYQDAGQIDKALPLFEETLRLKKAKLGPDHTDTLAGVNNLALTYQSAGQIDRALPLLEDTLQRVKVKLGPDHADTLTTMDNLAYGHYLAGQLDKALRLSEEAVRLKRVKLGPDHSKTLQGMTTLGVYYLASGQLDKALPVLEETVRLKKNKLGPDHINTLGSINNLARGYQAVGRLEEALPLLEENLRLVRVKLAPDHPDSLLCAYTLADGYLAAGQVEKALLLHQETLRVRKEKLGPDHSATLNSMDRLATCYQAAGQLDNALQLFEETVRRKKDKLGQDHPDTLASINNLAVAYKEADQFDKAVPLFEENLRLEKVKFGPGHPTTLGGMNNLASAYTGQIDKALPLLEEAVRLQKEKLGQDHPDTLTSINNLALVYQEAERFDEAVPLFEENLRLSKEKLGMDHPNTLKSMVNLANCYYDDGSFDKALPLFEEMLRLRKAKLGPQHPSTLDVMFQLAQVHLAMGGVDEGVQLLRELFLVNPGDSNIAISVGALQVWFGRKTDYEATCQELQTWAADKQNALVADAAAKVICLEPTESSGRLEAALKLGRRAVDLGQTNTMLAGWFFLSLGMAEYRNGDYAAAEIALTNAIQKASQVAQHLRTRIVGTANYYRAMALFRDGKKGEARQLFKNTEAGMKALPADEKRPLANGANHSDLILWLAYKETRALLQSPGTGANHAQP